MNPAASRIWKMLRCYLILQRLLGAVSIRRHHLTRTHYSDVIMVEMASQITSVSIVCSTVASGEDQRKHWSSASLAFVRGIYRRPVNPRTTGQQCGKCYHSMTSSWKCPIQIKLSYNSLLPPPPPPPLGIPYYGKTARLYWIVAEALIGVNLVILAYLAVVFRCC